MTDKDQDPFDQFEEMPTQEVISDEDSKSLPNSSDIDPLNACLHIAHSVLTGNISPVMKLGDSQRHELLIYIQGVLQPGVEELPLNDLPREAKAKPPSPSQEEASRVVQSPEEAQKERDFLDLLDI